MPEPVAPTGALACAICGYVESPRGALTVRFMRPYDPKAPLVCESCDVVILEAVSSLLPGVGGFGEPDAGLGLVRAVLRELKRRNDAAAETPFWDERPIDRRPLARLLVNRGIFEFLMGVLDANDLIDYGTSIDGAWPTASGERLLGLLDRIPWLEEPKPV